VVADTTDWRIEQGIQAAVQVWPHLLVGGEDSTWLESKMRAIAPQLGAAAGMSLPRTCSTTVEYAILARLLIEEQQLDPSVGKTGKYASKYHPQGSMKSIAIPSARSSRPLTVGEIQANWIDNNLLDTLLIKYAVDKKNPIPVLEDCIDTLMRATATKSATDSLSVQLQSLMNDIFIDCEDASQVVIAVQNESELSVAQQLLPSMDVSTLDALQPRSPSALIVGTDQQIIQALCDSDEASGVHYVGSNWAVMQSIRRRMVDNYPNLSLSIASWTCDDSQQNQAGMDPYIGVVRSDEVSEMLSARIVVNSKPSSASS
jgi:hypothetical protein